MKLIVKNSIYFILTFIVAIILLDSYIFLSNIETKSPNNFIEEYGRCRKSEMDYVYFNEGFSIGNFNKGGYLNSYYSKEKPDNVIRIGVLGDSYVEGFQVFERNHFLKLSERKLNHKYVDSVQILNFGRSGFDFGDMYVYYERLIKEYNCDINLFFVSNTDLNIKQKDVLIPKLKYANKELIITNDQMPKQYKESFINQIPFSNLSTIYKMLNDARKLIKSGELAPKLFDKFYKNSDVNTNNIFIEEANVQTADLSFKILLELQKEKSKIIIVNRDNSNLDPIFTSAINSPLLYFDLYKDSKLYKNNNDSHYWDISKKYGHWNIAGHKMVSESLSQFLNNLIVGSSNTVKHE